MRSRRIGTSRTIDCSRRSIKHFNTPIGPAYRGWLQTSSRCHAIAGREHSQRANSEASGLQPIGPTQKEGAAGVSEPSAASSNAESLAGKSAAQQVEFGHFFWVDRSGVAAIPLSFTIKQRTVTSAGGSVDLAVARAQKISGTGQAFAEASYAGEHINITDDFVSSTPCFYISHVAFTPRLLRHNRIPANLRPGSPVLLTKRAACRRLPG